MKTKSMILLGLLTVAMAAGGWWLASTRAEQPHRWEASSSDDGQQIWTCAMHREVHNIGPGQCPICGMALVPESPIEQGAESAAPLYWYDPMKPEVHFDAPGKSPFMDMELVPKYAAPGAGRQVVVSAEMVQSLGIRTARLERGSLWQRVDTVGTVAYNAHTAQVLESRVEAWVQDLAIHVVGEKVSKGLRLASLDAPELYAAQQEYLLAGRGRDTGLQSGAAERLRRLGMSQAQVEALRRSGKASPLTDLLSPLNGVVTSVNVHAGARVGPGQPLMQLAELSTVWVLAQVPESQIDWIREGTAAEVRLTSQPGEVLEAKVVYRYPDIDAATRTAKVRLELDNAQGLLRPGMFAEVVLYGGARSDVLLAPSAAVIRTGERNVVMKSLGEGRYEPVHVRLGAERLGQVIIEAGLSEGDEVVVSGQFLIDSEASLQGVYRDLPAIKP